MSELRQSRPFTVLNPSAFDPASLSRERFALDVLTGLSAERKTIPTKYFYDDEGSALFRRIMELEEYYPFRCEHEILSRNGEAIGKMMLGGGPFSLVELGAGDGRKTRLLLEAFERLGLAFRYVPIDISQAAVEQATTAVLENFSVPCRGLVSEYFDAFKWLNRREDGRKLVLFLGGNLGNFTPDDARVFLRTLWNSLSAGDHVLIGFDLKKDLDVMLRAYNDREGVTRRFNLNVLARINRELGGRFELSQFAHYGPFNVQTGAMESYLVSLRAQTVEVAELRKTFTFRPFEPIFLEYSYKFLPEDTLSLAMETGFRSLATYFDSKSWFLDALWEVVK
jgi:L-histidine N-alpha-methyltransferase